MLRTYRATNTDPQGPFREIHLRGKSQVIHLTPGAEFQLDPLEAKLWVSAGHLKDITDEQTTQSRESNSGAETETSTTAETTGRGN